MDKKRPLKNEGFGMAIADCMDDARVKYIRFQNYNAIKKEQKRVFQDHILYRKVNRTLFLKGCNTCEVNMFPQVFHVTGITD